MPPGNVKKRWEGDWLRLVASAMANAPAPHVSNHLHPRRHRRSALAQKGRSTQIIAEIEAQLSHEPAIETRNRKRLRPNELAEWELRAGRFRVFFDIDSENRLITVEAVGYKRGSRLFIGGEEYVL